MPMPSDSSPTDPETAQNTLIHYIKAWGSSSLPPTLTATLILPLHLRPPQFLPLLIPPVLLLSSYLNVNGFEKDAAGISSAWSAAYLVASRRGAKNHPVGFRQKFGARGLVRQVALGLCVCNVVGGGWVWWSGKGREIKEDEGS